MSLLSTLYSLAPCSSRLYIGDIYILFQSLDDLEQIRSYRYIAIIDCYYRWPFDAVWYPLQQLRPAHIIARSENFAGCVT